MTARWILFGSPCSGSYDVESAWPPPAKIRAVHDGSGRQAVLAPNEVPGLGQHVVEYELRSWGLICSRPGAKRAFVTYMRVGLSTGAQARAAESGLRLLEAVPAA